MPKFISRIRKSNSSDQTETAVCAMVHREPLQIWRANYLEATGKEATNIQLLEELELAVEEYNQSRKARVEIS